MKNQKPNLFLIIGVISILLLTGCLKEDLSERETATVTLKNMWNVSLVDGRLSFPDRESSFNTLRTLEDSTENELYDFLEEFYNQGFLSLRPPLTEETEEDIAVQYTDKIARFNDEYAELGLSDEEIKDRIDETQFVIGSDLFAAFLNQDGEILVGNEIYKYTDAGLFFVDEDNYDTLDSYLSNNNLSKTLIIPTQRSAMEAFVTSEGLFRGLSEIGNGEINYYVPLCDPQLPDPTLTLPIIGQPGSNEEDILIPCPGSGGGSGGNPNTNAPFEELDDFIEGLTPCTPETGGFFGWVVSLFGDNLICLDRYESKRRVRTKYYNHYYILYYTTGSNVKHQFKGWLGGWRVEANNAMYLSAEPLQLEYDYSSLITAPTPNFNPNLTNFGLKYSSNFNYFTIETNLWNSNTSYNYLNTQTHTQSLYPPIFTDDLTIETGGGGGLTANELNQHFWTTVWNVSQSQIRDLTNNPSYENPRQTMLLANDPDYAKLRVVRSYYKSGTNVGIRKINFDNGWSFNISLNYNASTGDFNYGVGSLPGAVLPKMKGIHLIGAAYGNAWHGSLMVIER